MCRRRCRHHARVGDRPERDGRRSTAEGPASPRGAQRDHSRCRRRRRHDDGIRVAGRHPSAGAPSGGAPRSRRDTSAIDALDRALPRRASVDRATAAGPDGPRPHPGPDDRLGQPSTAGRQRPPRRASLDGLRSDPSRVARSERHLAAQRRRIHRCRGRAPTALTRRGANALRTRDPARRPHPRTLGRSVVGPVACSARVSPSRRSERSTARSGSLWCCPRDDRRPRMAAPLSGEKILITGATGQVANPIAKALARDNEVWAVARFGNAGAREDLEDVGRPLRGRRPRGRRLLRGARRHHLRVALRARERGRVGRRPRHQRRRARFAHGVLPEREGVPALLVDRGVPTQRRTHPASRKTIRSATTTACTSRSCPTCRRTASRRSPRRARPVGPRVASAFPPRSPA